MATFKLSPAVETVRKKLGSMVFYNLDASISFTLCLLIKLIHLLIRYHLPVQLQYSTP